MIRTVAAVAIVAAAALGLAGCGGDDDDEGTVSGPVSSTSADETDEGQLKQAIREYTAAFFAPDADKGYSMLSERCQAQISSAEYSSLLDQAQEIYGQVKTPPTITIDELSGNLARASYGVGIPALDQQQQPWAKEGGAWHWDGC